MRDAAASPETVPRDIIDETIIQDTPERRLAVLGEIDEAYGRDVRAGGAPGNIRAGSRSVLHAPGPRIRRKIITIPIVPPPYADVEAHQPPRPCTAKLAVHPPPARADARSLSGRSP